MISLICQYCKIEYTVKPYRAKISKCCSRACLWHITKPEREPKRLQKISNRKAHNNKQIAKKCQTCKQDFKISPSRKKLRNHCSRGCYFKHISSLTDNQSKYIRITVNGVRLKEHRHVMEVRLKRKLKPSEIVHHINHNKSDNRIENLSVMTLAEHGRLHGREPFEK